MIRAFLALLCLLSAFQTWATTVYVTSVTSSEVQLIINGQAVRTLGIGDTSPEGVRLEGIQAGVASLQIDGRPAQMRIGQSTVTQTVLTSDARGHFITTARINGIPVRALIDTGATHVAMGAAQAQRMGINYLQGQRGISQTANGPINVYIVNLPHVQVGDIAFANVSASIATDATAQMPDILIGMSFLRHVEMRRAGNTLTLMRADR
jgi:aspartyl protease family protein